MKSARFLALTAALIGAGCSSSTTTSNTPEGNGSAASSSGTDIAPPSDSGSASAGASGDTGNTVGKQAVEVTGTYVTGDGPRSVADGKGKVVILDFWGTYCGPCKASFPKYQALLDQYGKDVAIIAISEDEPDSAKDTDLKKFAKDRGAKFVILWDKDHSNAKKYDMDHKTMPSSFIIDKSGKIQHVHVGYKDDEDKKIAAEVKDLLK